VGAPASGIHTPTHQLNATISTKKRLIIGRFMRQTKKLIVAIRGAALLGLETRNQ